MHLSIFVRQGVALAVLAPKLVRQFSRDAHLRFLAREELGDTVHLVTLPSKVTVQVELGVSRSSSSTRSSVGTGIEYCPYRLMSNASMMRSHSSSSSSSS